MDDTDLWQLMLERLERDAPVVVMIVVAHEGSAPGKPGFKMAVSADGPLSGTVGGGATEHTMVEEARQVLAGGERAPRLRRQVHHAQSEPGDRSGMICGGAQTVLLCPLTSGDLETVREVREAVETGTPGLLRVSAIGLAFVPGQENRDAHVFRGEEGEGWSYEETVGTRDTVYIIGGGHVGLALSRVLSILDFRVVVLDERPDVDTLKRNTYAHEKIVTPFDEAAEHVAEGDRSYAVIMTPAHVADEFVLRRLIDKPLRYLGLMASRHKRRKVFDHLLGDGVPQAKLDGVRSPVGIPIGSHTAAEIAVSIAAELIQVRNTP